MQLNKDWRIESDELNVILKKRYANRKTQKEYWVGKFFYATVESALDGFVDMQIRATGLKDLETVVAMVKELKQMIKKLEV